ncbi:tryptophan 2,3-dioxygenase [Nocardioides panacisoli]|uniref:tryptophan 2,3-dioxygenase n=1 Tax=Nocardioides panacisoli TaxID=627624 RepID=UPI001C62B429|nr:tryptophan 2,3-dioxygenase family protein [Nocardioides panacisoli]QYJ04604.1 tryptophan 2,3-dioxygenase [Nocardioides panacisoli]
MAEQHPALTYRSYLALDEVLTAQHPRSSEHDEMLFIVIHQVYELWFKELLHEFAHLQRRLEQGESAPALHTLRRILTVLKVAVAQVDVLETMTPRQFTSFRGRLDSSSGFQSEQFRELEAVLGRRDGGMTRHYPTQSPGRARIEDAMARPSVHDSFVRYLRASGYDVSDADLHRDVTRPLHPSADLQRVLLEVYADDAQPAHVAERLIDVDEGLQEWRYRHVKMVERTIGSKPGTGGSEGAGYLHTTLHRQVFPDLWAIRSQM